MDELTSPSVDIVGLIFGISLTWLLGTLLAARIFQREHNLPMLIGHGLMLGYLSVLLWLHVYDWIGRSFNFWEIVIVLLMAIAILLFFGNTRFSAKELSQSVNIALKTWRLSPFSMSLIALLITAVGFLTWLALSEVLLRPTYAWDAWFAWEPETLQYLQYGAFDIIRNTSDNPGRVHTGIHLWTMLSAGTHRTLLTHTPWVAAYIALLAAIYGHLRLSLGVGWSLLAAYLLASLPLMFTHAALPGYGDIWVTLSFTLGALVLGSRDRMSRGTFIAAMLIYATACILTKRVGVALALPLISTCLVVLVLEIFPRSAGKIMLITGAVAALASIAFVFGFIAFEFPFGGDIARIDNTALSIPGLFIYEFEPDVNLYPLAQAMFQFSSFSLLFPVLFVALIYGLTTDARALVHDQTLQTIFVGLGVIVLFYAVATPGSAQDHTGIDRTIMCFTPIACFWVVRFFGSGLRTELSGSGLSAPRD